MPIGLAIGLGGSVGATLALIGVVIWLLRRAFSAHDDELAEVKHAAELERALDARGRAVAERDNIITALQKQTDRYKRVSEKAGKLAEDALLASLHNPKDGGINASQAIKASLASLRELSFSDDVPTPTTAPDRPPG